MIGFVASGMAILMRQVWWHPVVVGSTIFSSLIFILFWDGEMQRLDAKGGIGLLINIVILVPVFILRWPDLEFLSKSPTKTGEHLTIRCCILKAIIC